MCLKVNEIILRREVCEFGSLSALNQEKLSGGN